MLMIQPTEHLTGLTISGDYWDLDNLIQAIRTAIGKEQHYFHYEGSRKRLVMICKKLREASKGAHDLTFVANGINRAAMKKVEAIIPERNVYYAASFLVPELIFGALALNDFVALYKETADDSEWSPITTTIRSFQALVSEAIAPFMTEEHFVLFLTTLHTKSPLFHGYATQYVDVLNLEYLALSKDERTAHVTSFALRLLAEDETYKVLKSQLTDVTRMSKQSIHEVALTLKYPKEDTIIW